MPAQTPEDRTRAPLLARTLNILVQVVVNSALAWAAAALIAAGVMVWLQGSYRLRFAQTAMVVGAFWLIAGGSLLGRLTTLSYQGWGIHVRGRDLVGDTMSTGRRGALTDFGISILVGPQLIVAGTLLIG